jgi:hypothetical protein
MRYSTQHSSRPRVREERFDEETFDELYKNYDRMMEREFKDYCIELIQSGTGKQLKKDEICGEIEDASSKGRVLKLTNDFMFAGMGLGV